MIELTIQSKYGNATRIFPHTVIAGSVRAKYAEGSPLVPIRSVQAVVHCFETRETGAMSSSRKHVVWEKRRPLWMPPDGAEEAPFEGGEWSSAFKVTIPPEAVVGATGTKCTREWRVGWRLEIVVEHRPIAHVGHRVGRSFALDLHDHRAPTVTIPSAPANMIIGSRATSAQLHIAALPGSYGPGDTVSVPLSVRPDDPTTLVKKMQVVLDRRVELLDEKSPPPERVLLGSHQTPGRPSLPIDSGALAQLKSSRITSIFNRGISPRRPLSQIESSTASEGEYAPLKAPSSSSPPRVVMTRIVEVTCDFTQALDNGTCWTTGHVPLPKRHAGWDLCVTERSYLASVSFELRVKLMLKKRGGSMKEVVSDPVPVFIVGCTAAERSAAEQAALNVTQSPMPAAAAASTATTAPADPAPADPASVASVAPVAPVAPVTPSSSVAPAKKMRKLTPEEKARRRERKSSPRGQVYMHDSVDLSCEAFNDGAQRYRTPPSSRARTPRSTTPPSDGCMPKPILIRNSEGTGNGLTSIQFAPTPAVTPLAVPDDGGDDTDLDQLVSPTSPMPVRQISPPHAHMVAPTAQVSPLHRQSGLTLPPLHSILSDVYSPKGPGVGAAPPLESPPIMDEYGRRTHSSRRRISAATSEEDDAAAPRAQRPRLSTQPDPTSLWAGRADRGAQLKREPLPSLDTLGLGLPALPEGAHRPTPSRRPRTAPSFGAYSCAPPPPLSGRVSQPFQAAHAHANGHPQVHGHAAPPHGHPIPHLGAHPLPHPLPHSHATRGLSHSRTHSQARPHTSSGGFSFAAPSSSSRRC